MREAGRVPTVQGHVGHTEDSGLDSDINGKLLKYWMTSPVWKPNLSCKSSGPPWPAGDPPSKFQPIKDMPWLEEGSGD